MKFCLIILVVLVLSSCHLFEEEPEVLLSSIDGKEYFAIKEGEMNVRKASLYILDGLKDSVNFDIQLDLLDSIESADLIWQKRYVRSLGIVLDDVYSGSNKALVEDKVFSFLLHCPKELLEYLNNDGFDEIDTWMKVLSKGLYTAVEPEGITSNSVVNAAIANCKTCNESEQELIASFIFKLERYNKLDD